jgi:hypothetical protein
MLANPRWIKGIVFLPLAYFFGGCNNKLNFNPDQVAEGPSDLVGTETPLNETFQGGASVDVALRPVSGTPDFQDCSGECRSYCDAQVFDNPADKALCPILWGVGLDTRDVVETEFCRRLFADTRGRFPTYSEVAETCLGRPPGDVVLDYLKSDEFVFGQQRRWADILGYNNVAVNVARIYDADKLVGKLYSGFIRFDEFVQVTSAHPVFTRRLNDAGDRAEALFTMFVGRPPFANERADMAKLYALWNNGYHDDPDFGMRFPDAFVEHKCIDDKGEIDEATAGGCTSVLWGFNRVVLRPDFRSIDGLTWSGNLNKAEWELLQTPGRIIASWPEVWEHMVSEVFQQYLGYDLAKYSPQVIKEVVEYVLRHGGDVRAAHYAVLTSAIYRQSVDCPGDTCPGSHLSYPWTYGPLKQAEAEQWIDSVSRAMGEDLGGCDYRIPEPWDLLEDSLAGYELVGSSAWRLRESRDGYEVDRRYAELAQTLGGCPDNLTSGRFKAVSILNTATQEAFVANLCNPGENEDAGADLALLLPPGMSPKAALDDAVAQQILDFQVGQFFGRLITAEEAAMAQSSVSQCVPKPCAASTFARGLCYALLSSSEMLFY